jgi:hypothetical protein
MSEEKEFEGAGGAEDGGDLGADGGKRSSAAAGPPVTAVIVRGTRCVGRNTFETVNCCLKP